MGPEAEGPLPTLLPPAPGPEQKLRWALLGAGVGLEGSEPVSPGGRAQCQVHCSGKGGWHPRAGEPARGEGPPHSGAGASSDVSNPFSDSVWGLAELVGLARSAVSWCLRFCHLPGR